MSRTMSSRLFLKVFLIIFVCFVCFVGGRVSAGQSHMKAALNALRNARSELQMASANKGGHRAKAIDLVNKAITEVNKGIEYAQ
jgi:hypothetical protein